MNKKAAKMANKHAEAIVQKVGEHLKQAGNGFPDGSPALARAGNQGKRGAFFWGAASGIAVMVAAPLLRPAARNAVKVGMRLGKQARKVGSSLKEEFEDITAEARAELDREQPFEGPGPEQA